MRRKFRRQLEKFKSDLKCLKFLRSYGPHVKENEKSEFHWMTSEWHNCQKDPVYTEYLPPRPNFNSFRPTTSRLRDKVVENQKSTEWRQTDLERLTFKDILYNLNNYPPPSPIPKFHPVSL